MSRVIGIDIGTQSVKTVLYCSDERRVLASGSSDLLLDQREDGSAEQHPHAWIEAATDAVLQIPNELRQSVHAIAVSGQQHGFVAVDADNRVLTPAKLWCDTSTTIECDEIMSRAGGFDSCISAAGNPVLVGYTASKIAYLKKMAPDLYDRMDAILLPHDYLNLVLTGERTMECGDASGTGLLDVRSRTWSKTMLKAVDPDRDLEELLPEPAQEIRIIGEVGESSAQRFGLPTGTPVASGGGDNMMAAIGTGAVSPGSLTMSLGTSGTVFGHSDSPIIDKNGEIAAFCSSTGGWMPLLCTMNCTVTTELLRDGMGMDISSFETAIAKAGVGADGVTVVPFFNGERTPNLPRGRGSIMGLTGTNLTRENLLRAGTEGASFALKFGVDRLAELGLRAEEITLTGGGSSSASWRQMIANICNKPVKVCAQSQGAAFGAALQALTGLDSKPNVLDITKAHVTYDEAMSAQPSPEIVEQYLEHYQTYQHYVDILSPLYK
jgi:xylulokinase